MPQLLTGLHPYLPPPPIPHHRHHHHHHHIKPLIIASSNNRFNFAANRITLFHSNRILLPSPLKSASINEVSVQNTPEASSISDEIIGRIREFVKFLPSIFPGGAWWNFSDEVDASIFGQPVTVWYALGKMWNLVARDRWVIFAAFSALIIAAVSNPPFFLEWFSSRYVWWNLWTFVIWVCLYVQVSEISIPHFLTASIFSAQGGNITVFHRNVRLLILLCGISGICRSKSCMVKSLLYLSLLYHLILPSSGCYFLNFLVAVCFRLF